MPKVISKLLISFLAFLVLFLGVVPPSMAQSTCSITASANQRIVSYKVTGCGVKKAYRLEFKDSSSPVGASLSTTDVSTDGNGAANGTLNAPKSSTYDLILYDGLTKVGSTKLTVTFSDTTSGAIPVPATPGPWYNQDFGQWYSKVYDSQNSQEIFGERYTAAQVQWVFYGVVSMVVNQFLSGNPTAQQCLLTILNGNVSTCASSLWDTRLKPEADNSKGKSIFASLFENRPLSGVNYFRNIGQKLNIIPQAKAQSPGFGYSAFTFGGGASMAIQNLWTTIRDLSYAVFVVVIVVMAFMIMFRVKISPQVVVTVQSALPKVVIGLILVTFSWAIAGFMVDIMYVAIGILSFIFSKLTVAGVAFNVGQGGSVAGYFDMLTNGPIFGLAHTGIVGMLVMYLVNYVIGWLDIVASGLVNIVANLAPGEAVLAVITLIIGFIGLIVLVIVAIINIFRILFLLGKTFLILIFLTVFAPLQFTLAVVLPGIGFGAWVKSYLSKLAVFVGVGAMFIFALWLLQIGVDVSHAGNATGFTQGWPPLLGSSPQMLALGFLIASIAIFVMIPKVGDMIEGFVGGRGFVFGTAIGQAVTGPFAAGAKIAGAGIGLADVGLDAYLALQFARGAGGQAPRTGFGRVINWFAGGRNQGAAPVAPGSPPPKANPQG